MFELLSFIFGGVFRLIPEGMKLYDKGRERQHEKDMLDLQMRADTARAQLEMQKAELQGNITMNSQELQAIIEATKAQAQTITKTGNKWLDAFIVLAETLSITVRPVLTYWYCVMAYGAYKTASFMLVLESGEEWKAAIQALWTTQDHAIMVSIIGFWFVDRAIRRQV